MHPHGRKYGEPSALGAALWGFPIYFSPEADYVPRHPLRYTDMNGVSGQPNIGNPRATRAGCAATSQARASAGETAGRGRCRGREEPRRAPRRPYKVPLLGPSVRGSPCTALLLHQLSRYSLSGRPAIRILTVQSGRVYEIYVHMTAKTLQGWGRDRMVILKRHARYPWTVLGIATYRLVTSRYAYPDIYGVHPDPDTGPWSRRRLWLAW